MIVTKGYGSSSLIVTKGYGRRYLTPFARIGNFEKSFYRYVKENYVDFHSIPVFYGNVTININVHDYWIYCGFSELNVETGKFSVAYVDVITRIAAIDEYDTRLAVIVDDLRNLFVNSDIDLYDFTYNPYPLKLEGSKIIINREGKRRKRLDMQVFERVDELEFEGIKSLLQATQITIKMRLLRNFTRSRTVVNFTQ